VVYIVTEESESSDTLEERDVIFLSNPPDGPDTRFVSLVRYGANGIPFNVVKNEKIKNEDDFMPMKVLQAVVTTSGITDEVVKSAFNEEVRDAVNLKAPKTFGSFISYEQAPRESFKSESLEVVALNDDQTIFGIQGELTEQSNGLVSKLFKKPTQKSEYIGMSDADAAISQEVLKSRLSSVLWEERSALRDLIDGVFGQEKGDVEQKIAIVELGMANFLESVRTAVETLKCEKLTAPEKPDDTNKAEKVDVEKKNLPLRRIPTKPPNLSN
jgi:hypothetical protein